jgi:hypothetical protein
MFRRASLVLVSVLLLVLAGACKKERSPSEDAAPPPKEEKRPPPIENACTKDEECAWTAFNERCCMVCEPRIGTVKWRNAVQAVCTDLANVPLDCGRPVEYCEYKGEPLHCRSGKCVSGDTPPLDDTCTTNEDCGETPFDALCCKPCQAEVGNRAAVAQRTEYCRTLPDAKQPKCGGRLCSVHNSVPRCRDGRCRR